MKKLIFTKRRRLVNISIKKVGLSIAALLLVSLCINFIPTTVKAQTCEPTSYESVMIKSGDTLWNIATEYNSGEVTTNDYIDEIKDKIRGSM